LILSHGSSEIDALNSRRHGTVWFAAGRAVAIDLHRSTTSSTWRHWWRH